MCGFIQRYAAGAMPLPGDALVTLAGDEWVVLDVVSDALEPDFCMVQLALAELVRRETYPDTLDITSDEWPGWCAENLRAQASPWL